MARPLRIEYPGAWYHVLNRGRRKEKIFFSPADYREFLRLLGECYRLFNIEIHAFSLIPNHYHLLVHTPKANLSRCMRHLNGVYTQFINRRYKTEGSLFKGRFKSILIDKDNYLSELVRYIHRNPLKAKLEKRIGEHAWTSHRGYMNDRERPEWLKTEHVLLEFSDHENEARTLFNAFVNKETPQELSKVLDSVKWPAILGGKEFTDSIKQKLKGKKIEKRDIPQLKNLSDALSPYHVTKKVEEIFQEEGFLSRKKTEAHLSIRRAVSYLCRQYLDMPWRDTCAILGGITQAALSHQFAAAREEVRKREGCYKDFQKIAEAFKLYI
ncbi:transposase [Candidatus Omnitrophota bacterium]